MLNAITRFFAAIPENANLRLLLSESRRECTVLQAKVDQLQAKVDQIQATVEQRDNQITELKSAVQLLERENQDCNNKLKGATYHSGPLKPEWGEP